MWETILVVAIVLAAAAVVARRIYRTLTGQSRCNCPQSPRCPAAKTCDDPKAQQHQPPGE